MDNINNNLGTCVRWNILVVNFKHKTMRTIKYRGKRLDNGAWETGGFVELLGSDMPHNHYVIDKRTGHHTPVIPETVGQFTNISDWDCDTEIYEDDVVSNGVRNYVIKYVNGCYWLVNKNAIACYRLSDIRTEIKVLGSIHDNPELLKTE